MNGRMKRLHVPLGSGDAKLPAFANMLGSPWAEKILVEIPVGWPKFSPGLKVIPAANLNE